VNLAPIRIRHRKTRPGDRLDDSTITQNQQLSFARHHRGARSRYHLLTG
jgi:hypothetical protein